LSVFIPLSNLIDDYVDQFNRVCSSNFSAPFQNCLAPQQRSTEKQLSTAQYFPSSKPLDGITPLVSSRLTHEVVRMDGKQTDRKWTLCSRWRCGWRSGCRWCSDRPEGPPTPACGRTSRGRCSRSAHHRTWRTKKKRKEEVKR
jgi:hypothetical protein